MRKLIIVSGLPGSGKSTYARKLVSKIEDSIRVNRDDIRSMLGTYWVSSRESFVSNIEKSIVTQGLKDDRTVIVDATNLNKIVIQEFQTIASDMKAEYERIIINTPLRICIFRDWKRGLFGGRRVGAKVIKGFYNRYKHILDES